MAINYSTDVGQVRLLIADLDEAKLIFTDEQLTAYLSLSDGTVKLAAARALRAMATSEVLLARKITTQDLSTDGPAAARELRAQAKALEDEDAAEAGSFFGFVPLSDGYGLEGEEVKFP